MRTYPGLKPWDLDRITRDELVALVGHAKALDRHMRQMMEAADGT